MLAAVHGRAGLEIGGPSPVFKSRGILPVYRRASRVDNVNFSAKTTWETGLMEGGEFHFHSERPAGRQWLRDATELTGLADEAYDFILSSHCLEHIANPLRALREWRRVVRPGGHIILILPDPVHSFDHRRPITTLEHLRVDFARNTGEDDTTHVEEVLALHDLRRDPWAGSPEAFHARVQSNSANRCLHHHVFNVALLAEVLTETGWEVLATATARPVHLVGFARNPNVNRPHGQ